jgi:hypothetical protein
MTETLYMSLANTMFALHLLFVLAAAPSTLLFAGGWYRSRPLLAQLHCAAVLAMVVGQAVARECPLVTAERAFREAAGHEPWYEGSFIVFVIDTVTGLTPSVNVATGYSAFVALFTLVGLVRLGLPIARGQTAA